MKQEEGLEKAFSVVQAEPEEFGREFNPELGAGKPRILLEPGDIPPLLMHALFFNDEPSPDAGLRSMWDFTGAPTRRKFYSNDLPTFLAEAKAQAREWPASFFGAALAGRSWELEGPVVRVGGDGGWVATQVVRTYCRDGRSRRWQWELRENRRPPQMGCWYVEQIAASDMDGDFDADSLRE